MTNNCIKELVGLINLFQIYPQYVSVSGCHLQGGRRCLRSYSSNICVVGVYGLRSVQCGQFHDWPQWTDRNPYAPTTQILLD
jgi:hypothetical protein